MTRTLGIALCLLALSARPSLATPFTWAEVGSAGNLPGTANVTVGAGPLALITGNLSDLVEVDMFQIMIVNFSAFSATTDAGVNLVSDPQLFLFDASGLAVYMNDDGPGLGGQSALPAGSGLGPSAVGLYYLAIGWFDNEPLSAAGRMFLDGTGTNGPDPVGGASPVIAWNGDVTGRIDPPTAYNIRLTGAAFTNAQVPEPSTMLLLGGGIAALLGRKCLRRRRVR